MYHEVADQPMEDHAVVVSFGTQPQEVLARLGHEVAAKLRSSSERKVSSVSLAERVGSECACASLDTSILSSPMLVTSCT